MQTNSEGSIPKHIVRPVLTILVVGWLVLAGISRAGLFLPHMWLTFSLVALSLIILIGAGMSFIAYAQTQAETPAALADTQHRLIDKPSGIAVMRHRDRIFASIFRPFKIYLLALAVGLPLVYYLDSPDGHVFIPLYLGGCMLVPFVLMVSWRRARRFEVRCPQCATVLIGPYNEDTTQEVLRTRQCPRCQTDVLEPLPKGQGILNRSSPRSGESHG